MVTNGTAILGLANLGALASKPVMEGKAVLFKKFAGIDVFDIEINERDPEKLVEIIASLEPTFGGINLEDIKAPECFIIEQGLKERMNIPVFHDDQHGTAVVVLAATLNALRITGKRPQDMKLVVTGAGAAGWACTRALKDLGTWLFIKGIALREQGKTDEAKKVFEDIINNYSFSQCYDQGGWYWKIADGAKDEVIGIDKGVDFFVRLVGKDIGKVFLFNKS